MNTLRKWTSISCTLLSIAAYSVAITCSAHAQAESKSTMMMVGSKGAPHKVLTATIPSPQSGIKLIEYISLRMHTLKGPVIAKNATYAVPPQEKSQGPTNQLLAIKPPVTGYAGPREQDRESASDKKAANEEQKAKKKADSDAGRSDRPTAGDDNASGGYYAGGPIAYGRRQSAVPASSSSSLAKAKEAPQAASSETTATAYGRMANGKLGAALSRFRGALQTVDEGMSAADSSAVGGKDLSTKARAKSARQEASYQIASNKPSGMWEAPARGVLLQQQGFQNSANVKDARMAAAAGSNSSDQAAAEPQSPPMPPAYYRTTSQRLLPPANMGKRVSQPGDNLYAPSSAGIAGGGGSANVRDYYSAQRKSTIASATVPSASPVPAQQGQSFLIPPPPTVIDGLTQNSSTNFQKQKTEIAMLAPNVVMGIPLVRLGSSALEANKALTSVKGNKLKQQSISGWTVYVLHKANSVEPAMQVYVRHGLVEALRIFDNAFIAPDFGVQLNDDVSTVKAKFGEPTFMHPEADCPSAQNYIYPISQVSFELRRPANSPTPKVSSVLIFTVK
ncbi:MAG: hypothetical protein JST89_00930 [Cyanobacteria bacterium SZAS-4]|nr:hypothetical protein [Cyanobacteria bacterium SZAS-4]